MILYCAYNFMKTCWLKSKGMLTAKWTALNLTDVIFKKLCLMKFPLL
jgi:hypothetical protein